MLCIINLCSSQTCFSCVCSALALSSNLSFFGLNNMAVTSKMTSTGSANPPLTRLKSGLTLSLTSATRSASSSSRCDTELRNLFGSLARLSVDAAAAVPRLMPSIALTTALTSGLRVRLFKPRVFIFFHFILSRKVFITYR